MTSSEQSAQETATSPEPASSTPRGEAGRQDVPQQAPRHAGEAAYEEGAYQEGAYQDSGAAKGLTILAAVLMMVSGAWMFLEGLAAVIRGSFFVVLPHYIYSISVTGWGWFHLILGVIVAAVGAAVLTGRLWARVIAVAIVAASAVINFLYIPYQPWWSIALIAVDGLIIWALLVQRDEYTYT
jgi:hypothetical protein